MAGSMAESQLAELERAFSQSIVPDSYELINVYKLYDETLEVENLTKEDGEEDT